MSLHDTPDEREARRAINARLLAAAAERQAAVEQEKKKRDRKREADAARQRRKLGLQKRHSTVHPLKLTFRQAQLYRMLQERPMSIDDIKAAMNVKKTTAYVFLRDLRRKLAAAGKRMDRLWTVAP